MSSFNDKRLLRLWKFEAAANEEPKIISKSITEAQLKSFNKTVENLHFLKAKFIESQNLEGLQLCPHRDLRRLVDHLKEQTQYSELSIWLYFMLDVEPLLMPYLHNKGFPVPRIYATCGLSIFQAYVGKALLHYYNHEHFKLKLKMSKQLLEAAVKFSKGFNGFRIYITDLSADNVIWNEETERLYFVDLDSVIILDSKSKQLQQQTHKHVYIECENCFAYSQQDICSYQLSDINIFAVCQLLREDLSQKREAGFLYPIPEEVIEKHTKLTQLLDECVDCLGANCFDRFDSAFELIQLFELIITEP